METYLFQISINIGVEYEPQAPWVCRAAPARWPGHALGHTFGRWQRFGYAVNHHQGNVKSVGFVRYVTRAAAAEELKSWHWCSSPCSLLAARYSAGRLSLCGWMSPQRPIHHNCCTERCGRELSIIVAKLFWPLGSALLSDKTNHNNKSKQ